MIQTSTKAQVSQGNVASPLSDADMRKLTDAFKKAKFETMIPQMQQWCAKQNITTIGDVIVSLENLGTALALKPLQQKRLLRLLQNMEGSQESRDGSN